MVLPVLTYWTGSHMALMFSNFINDLEQGFSNFMLWANLECERFGNFERLEPLEKNHCQNSLPFCSDGTCLGKWECGPLWYYRDPAYMLMLCSFRARPLFKCDKNGRSRAWSSKSPAQPSQWHAHIDLVGIQLRGTIVSMARIGLLCGHGGQKQGLSEILQESSVRLLWHSCLGLNCCGEWSRAKNVEGEI